MKRFQPAVKWVIENDLVGWIWQKACLKKISNKSNSVATPDLSNLQFSLQIYILLISFWTI